jgi:hypothetical protein
MKRSIAFGFPALALSLLAATAAAAQSYPPPQPPYDPGPGAYNNDQPPPDDQGYPDQGPYYDPQPDGSYQDQQPYDDQSYPDQGAYGNQGLVDESVFYSELSPYGRWIQRGSYGWVWEPTRVAVGWRPYTQGHWVNTDYGWTWVSDEPWGWATYHYGRWLLDREYGWLWVPGTEWGPAWVSFQQGGGYLGWAPLPPSVGFRAGIGIQIGGLSLSADIDPYAYSFVPERSFLNERIATEILPPARNVTFVRNTRNITNIREENHRIVNRSVPVEHIQQVTGRPVRQYRLAEVRNPAQGRVAHIQGDQVTIFRPAPTLAPPRPNVTPQVVIQQRRQQLQQRQAGQRTPQPDQPGQPGPRVRPMQPQTGQAQAFPQPRPVPSGADLERKHQAEQQQLQARQEAERNRLQQLHDQERGNQQAVAQHQAEQRALQEQHQREQQMLQARHQREQQAAQAAQARPQRQAPPPQQNQPRETQQRRQREQQRAEEDRQRQQPPPPPPI